MTEQWVIRPVSSRDIDPLVALARALGPGMTTLPADADAIARKIANSVATFADQACADPQYLLVLEDMPTGEILGLSGVYPHVGQAHGFFSYKLTRLVQRSVELGRRYEIELLTLSNDYTGATEIGTLAVLPELRGTGAGRMLARARYMLIGAFPERFATIVMAEMRGWQNMDGQSPFWNAIGARFFDMAFAEADRLSAIDGNGFIADLMPKQPIYTALLPDEARAAIGRPHEVSARAMSMLVDEDFCYDAHVDVFDGGPQVHAARDRIRTIRDTRMLDAAPGSGEMPLLVSNRDLARFRLVQAFGTIMEHTVAVPPLALSALGCDRGTQLRVAPGYRRAV